MLDWKDVVHLSDEDLGRYDIAAVNLACAVGLPDAGGIDPDLATHRLDFWSRRVGQATEQALPQFRRKRHDYRNSEGYFRMLVLVEVLQRDCGVRYNRAKIPGHVPLNTADIFVHGVTQGWGGTCASLPVVYAAVGRRLGYPLKLALARTEKSGHCFVRWDDPSGERFNVEATSLGMNSDPDDYYRTGVYQVTPADERGCCLLRSLTPRQELASFLMERGHRWLDFGRHRRALEAFAWGCALHSENDAYLNSLHTHLQGWEDSLGGLRPPGFPALDIHWPPRRYPNTIPEVLERGIIALEATENLLKSQEFERDWWAPLRRRERVVGLPQAAVVVCEPTQMHIRFRYDPTVDVRHRR
jgi:hypothetical protein